MQYALVGSKRSEAFPSGQGECPVCGFPTIAKCGSRVIHHWAHQNRKECDTWWENETEWHREWKSHFPEECREVAFTAPNGEVHRADVVTRTGIVIEFQHSAITDAERASRETFYQNLVWIVDGKVFRKNFDIYHHLPHPKSQLTHDIRWFKATRQKRGAARGIFWRLSENPGYTAGDLVRLHALEEIKDRVFDSYKGHHQYDWVKPHRTWLDSACPVYIDFGDDSLARLETYDEYGLQCVCLVPKQKLVEDAMQVKVAVAIATADLV